MESVTNNIRTEQMEIDKDGSRKNKHIHHKRGNDNIRSNTSTTRTHRTTTRRLLQPIRSHSTTTHGSV